MGERVLHIYPKIKIAKKGFNLFLTTPPYPDRFNSGEMSGVFEGDTHFFMGMGLWSNFQKIQRIRPTRIRLYFRPLPRTLMGIQTFSQIPHTQFEYIKSGVLYAS